MYVIAHFVVVSLEHNFYLRPLQEVLIPRSYAPPIEPSVGHASSYAASQSSINSFSVFEDESCADQSSLAPFHDSWSNAPAPPQQQRQQGMGVAKIYHAPLEAPLMLHGDNNVGGNFTMEQSFTQFDIRHPNSFEPVSTPMGARSGELRQRVRNIFHDSDLCTL